MTRANWKIRNLQKYLGTEGCPAKDAKDFGLRVQLAEAEVEDILKPDNDRVFRFSVVRKIRNTFGDVCARRLCERLKL
ncbi:MAG: hypothetical protein ACFB6R_13310 [Alphaproteobacteria bacterium]